LSALKKRKKINLSHLLSEWDIFRKELPKKIGCKTD